MNKNDMKRKSQNQTFQGTKYERILGAATNGIVLLDKNGIYTYANPAAERILDIKCAQILNKCIDEISQRFKNLQGVQLPDDELPFEKALHEERLVFDKKCIVEQQNGDRVVISTNAAPFYDTNGDIDGVVGIFTDITTEQELHERNSAFLHTVAHDLRTPLTAIIGYAEVLQQSFSGPIDRSSSQQCIDEILKSSLKMEKMIQDLVDKARLEGGSFAKQTKSIKFADFLAGTLKQTIQQTMDMNRLSIQIQDNLPTVSVDPEHLERILINLLSNAMKFSPSESKVSIRATSKNNEIEVSVSDEGPGVAPEDFSRLFQRFERINSYQSPEGVGLGLYISRLLVEANGGRIWLESILGRGSIFKFTLPSEKS